MPDDTLPTTPPPEPDETANLKYPDAGEGWSREGDSWYHEDMLSPEEEDEFARKTMEMWHPELAKRIWPQ